MGWRMTLRIGHAAWTMSLCLGLVAAPRAGGAQTLNEIEPNDECLSAQPIVDPQLPVVVQGAQTTGDADQGIPSDTRDFFRFELPPGLLIRATGTAELRDIPSPFDKSLGLFFDLLDSSCNFIGVQMSVSELTATARFQVPDDGVVITGIFVAEDEIPTPFEISVLALQAPSGPVSGQVVDATSGAPIQAQVDVALCTDTRCRALFVDRRISTDRQGRFASPFRDDDDEFSRRSSGFLAVLVSTPGQQFQEMQFGPFALTPGEPIDVGVLRLPRNDLTIENISPCPNPGPAGGICRFSFDVRNNSDALAEPIVSASVRARTVRGDRLSSLEAQPEGADRNGFDRPQLRIDPAGTGSVSFEFTVPALADFTAPQPRRVAEFCAETVLRSGPALPDDVLHTQRLFCIQPQVSSTP